jgi:hypothetical protein
MLRTLTPALSLSDRERGNDRQLVGKVGAVEIFAVQKNVADLAVPSPHRMGRGSG